MSCQDNFEQELRNLTDQLQNLRVQQEQVQQAIDTILAINTRREQTATPQRTRTPVARHVVEVVETEVAEEIFYTETFTPRVNDQVRILNPKRWQPKRGTIQGFTSDGKVKIYTRNRQTILRLPKNVVCTRRHHE